MLSRGADRIIARTGRVWPVARVASVAGLPAAAVRRRACEVSLAPPVPPSAVAELWHRHPVARIADILETSPEAVVAAAHAAGLVAEDAPEANYERFAPAEIRLLRTRYGKASPGDIARALGRSVEAVKSAARRLGLAAEPSPAWAPAQDAVLSKLWGKLSSAKIGAVVGRTGNAVRARARALGLTT